MFAWECYMDWHRIRSDFPILAQQVQRAPAQVYLDSAASRRHASCRNRGPSSTLQGHHIYYERDNPANVHRALHELSTRATDAFEARAQESRPLHWGRHGERDHLHPRHHGGHQPRRQHLGRCRILQPGDVILVTGMEHHSNLVPWQLLAQRTGATLKHIPVLDDGTLDLRRPRNLLTPQVKLFAFVHISNSLGTINPARELCAKAKAVGAVTLPRWRAKRRAHAHQTCANSAATSSPSPATKCAPPPASACFTVAWNSSKTCPRGTGGGEMILSVTLEASTYKPPPHRFEAGTPDIAGVIGLGPPPSTTWRPSASKTSSARPQPRRLRRAMHERGPGIRILGPQSGQRGSLVAFHLDSAHPHDLVEFANTHGIAMRGGHHCTQPLMKRFKVPGTTRASFYFYNTIEEINRLVEVLRRRRANSSPDAPLRRAPRSLPAGHPRSLRRTRAITARFRRPACTRMATIPPAATRSTSGCV
jgi:cysteine desulfurase/selenocysteine lyase